MPSQWPTRTTPHPAGMRLHEMAPRSPGYPTASTRRTYVETRAGEALVGDLGFAVLGEPGRGQSSYGQGSYARNSCCACSSVGTCTTGASTGRQVVVLDAALCVMATESPMAIDLSEATAPKPFDPLAVGPVADPVAAANLGGGDPCP